MWVSEVAWISPSADQVTDKGQESQNQADNRFDFSKIYRVNYGSYI